MDNNPGISLRGGLRGNLVLLVLVTLIPMLAWAAGLTVWNARQQQQLVEGRLREGARNITLAVDQEILGTIESLRTMALSHLLRTGQLERFHDQLTELVSRHPSWRNLVLVSPTGTELLNTRDPFGVTFQELGPLRDVFTSAQSSGLPAVSRLFSSRVGGEPSVAVAVPVQDVSDSDRGVLIAILIPQRISELLTDQGDPGWFAGVNDGTTIIARFPLTADAVGRTIPEWTRRAQASGPAGIARGISITGEAVTAAVTRSPVTGWNTVYGAPEEAFISALRRDFVFTAGFGLLVLMVSLAVAMAVSRRILVPVRELTAIAAPFIPDDKDRSDVYPIRELDELHRAIDGLSEALAESETRFRQLFAAAPVMLDVIGPDGRLAEVNQTWLSTLGYQRSEVLGRHQWEFQTPESAAHCRDVVHPRLLETGAVVDAPLQFLTRDGEIRDVLMSAIVQRDRDGKALGVVAALSDVTDQRRTEKALERAVEDAELANAAKTRFMAAASHDLRQPLQALSLYLNVLEGRMTEADRPVMTAVDQCLQSLSGLLNDLLDVSRLEAGIITPKPVDVPVAQIVERVAASWRIQAAEKGLELRTVVCASVLRTDPALMERILSNLVANAVRYTECGRILLGCRRVGAGWARLEVWDTGIGIPPDQIGRIFEEFHQVGNPERNRDKGTGLGLAIVRRIARLLGVGVEVRSWPGRGSVFSVMVPLADGGVGQAAGAQAQAVTRRRHIVLVEDEPHVRNALELALAGLGHRVASGSTVDQALVRLNGVLPELIVADYRLAGGVTGVDAIKAVRNRYGHVPAVVLTGDTDPAIIRHIAAEGLHLLHKPLQMDALRSYLGQVG